MQITPQERAAAESILECARLSLERLITRQDKIRNTLTSAPKLRDAMLEGYQSGEREGRAFIGLLERVLSESPPPAAEAATAEPSPEDETDDPADQHAGPLVTDVLRSWFDSQKHYNQASKQYTVACRALRAVCGSNYDAIVHVNGMPYRLTTDADGHFDVEAAATEAAAR